MRADPQAFLPFVSAQLTPEAIDRDRDAALMVSAAALSRAPGTSWPRMDEVFTSDPELGKAVFEKVAYGERADLASELDDGSLQSAARWAAGELPARRGPEQRAGAGFVTPRDQAGQVRDRLLAVLAQRGTDDAIAAIDAFASKFPSYSA